MRLRGRAVLQVVDAGVPRYAGDSGDLPPPAAITGIGALAVSLHMLDPGSCSLLQTAEDPLHAPFNLPHLAGAEGPVTQRRPLANVQRPLEGVQGLLWPPGEVQHPRRLQVGSGVLGLLSRDGAEVSHRQLRIGMAAPGIRQSAPSARLAPHQQQLEQASTITAVLLQVDGLGQQLLGTQHVCRHLLGRPCQVAVHQPHGVGLQARAPQHGLGRHPLPAVQRLLQQRDARLEAPDARLHVGAPFGMRGRLQQAVGTLAAEAQASAGGHVQLHGRMPAEILQVGQHRQGAAHQAGAVHADANAGTCAERPKRWTHVTSRESSLPERLDHMDHWCVRWRKQLHLGCVTRAEQTNVWHVLRALQLIVRPLWLLCLWHLAGGLLPPSRGACLHGRRLPFRIRGPSKELGAAGRHA
mmetsp:Transcript_67859/g.201980  ORF Transcript_67859/g.201980 Transcript_67859/m.201980 type:complete len:411 (+) Transcript_67859:1036-2268(+)